MELPDVKLAPVYAERPDDAIDHPCDVAAKEDDDSNVNGKIDTVKREKLSTPRVEEPSCEVSLHKATLVDKEKPEESLSSTVTDSSMPTSPIERGQREHHAMYKELKVAPPKFGVAPKTLGHYFFNLYNRIFAALYLTARRCETAHVDLVLSRAQ